MQQIFFVLQSVFTTPNLRIKLFSNVS